MDNQTPSASLNTTPQNSTQQDTQLFVRRAIESCIKIAVLAALALACYSILKPFIAPIIWAGIIAVAVKPLCDLIERKINSRKIAAGITTLLLLSVLIYPTYMFASSVIKGSQQLANKFEAGELHIPSPKERVKEWPLIGESTYEIWYDVSHNLSKTVIEHKDELSSFSKSLGSKIASAGIAVIVLVFSILISGIFLANADKCREFIHKLAKRLAGDVGEQFASLASVTIRGVTQGILGVAALQGMLAGIGFTIMDIPAAPVLGLGVLILSVIQISPSLILIPVSIYAFSVTGPVAASIFLIWNLAVSLMDNVLKPIIMGKGSSVPMLVIFLGALGGFISMGFVGLFIGAVVLVLAYELFRTWLIFHDTPKNQSAEVTTSE